MKIYSNYQVFQIYFFQSNTVSIQDPHEFESYFNNNQQLTEIDLNLIAQPSTASDFIPLSTLQTIEYLKITHQNSDVQFVDGEQWFIGAQNLKSFSLNLITQNTVQFNSPDKLFMGHGTQLQEINIKIKDDLNTNALYQMQSLIENISGLENLIYKFIAIQNFNDYNMISNNIFEETDTSNLQFIQLYFYDSSKQTKANKQYLQTILFPLVYYGKTNYIRSFNIQENENVLYDSSISGTYPAFSVNEQCVSNYSQAQFYNTQAGKCENCVNSNCHSCLDNTSCYNCRYSTVARQTPECNCPDGYYGDSKSYECLACPAQCAKCSSNKSCTECKQLDRDSKNNCSCPAGTYELSLLDPCQSCPDRCQTCTSSTICKSCFTNDRDVDQQCICPSGYFESSFTSTCTKCNSQCATCSSQNSCDSCIMPDRDPINCLCLPGFYEISINDPCQICPIQCATCSDSQTCILDCNPNCDSQGCNTNGQCYNCQPNFIFNNGKCESCKSGQEIQNNQCVQKKKKEDKPDQIQNCHFTCLTCQNEKYTDCLTCDKNSELVKIDTNDENGLCISETNTYSLKKR
ncbi:Insulin-like growth factor binding protein, N-terminal [Pseudocohnilembus persalinus]|uniref:Insulin-like growth factor binding protein, N-terminal n=1 Tax=Pseudocohnilembus persalinus TaxID=266149 RepID=A0A0V0QV96_PSEPJ|nr:Insulin-like growth factor binding protein, N-terminal [Pseudocohnilembus persalinus]|eukprot:KRX06171.1 Insulin-like growth factor binding protein, N-terminal [Pseudocohnilembus persalinus]